MRNEKKCMVFLAVCVLTAGAYGHYYDNFEYADTSELVGQGGWVTNYNPGTTEAEGTPQLSLVVSGDVVYDGLGWNNGAYNFSGAARDASGDVEAGEYQVVVTLHGQASSSWACNFILTIGDYGITDPNVTTANHLTLIHDDRPTVHSLSLAVHRNGVYEYLGAPEVSLWGADYGKHQLKVTVDLNLGTADVYFRDIDDTTFDPISDWSLLLSLVEPLPMTSITQVGIGASDYKYIYDFESGFKPAPPSCAAVLAEGYSLDRDLNSDCHVNLVDFSLLASDWMRCVIPGQTGCETPWLD